MDRRQIRKGSIEEAFDKADVIVQGVYRPAAIEHVPLETQVALVVPEANGRLTIYSARRRSTSRSASSPRTCRCRSTS